jgi:hypothetical protein
LDLGTQTCSVLGFLLLALVLLWSELGVERRATVPLNEFLLVGDLVMNVVKPLMASHGGMV